MKLFSLRILLEFIGLLLCAIIVGIGAYPSILFISWVSSQGILQTGLAGVFLFSILIGINYIVFGLTLMILVGLIRNVLLLKSVEGEISLYSWEIVSFTIYHGLINIVDHIFLRFIRATQILNLFYRMMGLHIGKYTIINTTRISDCDLITIGAKTVIGGDVVINGHSAEGDKLIRKKIYIGNNVTIGQYVTVLPGVVIEDNVIVGANSVIPKNKILKKGRIYCGVPVRDIGSSDSKFF